MRDRGPDLLKGLALAALRAVLRFYPPGFRARFQARILDDAAVEFGVAASRRRLASATARMILDSVAGIVPEWRSAAGFRRRHEGGTFMFHGISSDVRLAVRRLRAQGASTLLILCTLGLALGASTAIFSVVDAVLLRPLPLPAADQLVRIDEQTVTRGRVGLSLPMADIVAAESRALAGLALYEPRTALVVLRDEADRLAGST